MPAKKKKHSFKAFQEGFDLPKTELEVLNFWKTDSIFEKSLSKRKRGPHFVFYEGPPSANAMPHIGHMETRVFKDVILRFRTMQGYYVPRKGGWDTHGLPIELQVEKELGFRNKQDIEAYGIKEFNKKCRDLVWKYKQEWDNFTERIGFWLDLKDPYITYENDYIESLWWIIKEIYGKGLMTQGHKIVPWCSRCGTGLSSHELAQGYKEVVDNSVYMKFKLMSGQRLGTFETDEKTYVTSWTTTPWTLPGNIALAIGEDITYVVLDSDGEKLIVAEDIYKKENSTFKGLIKLALIKGSSLVGASYKPLFKVKELEGDKSYKIYAADFVTTTDGTGVVHTAVMYGEDDYKLGVKIGLPQVHTVTEQGKFIDGVAELAGLYVKAKDTETKIFEHLKANGNFIKTEEYAHEYPHCWRCGTPILYYARTSWFILMTKVKKDLLDNNQKINWVPDHIKKGRFGEWIKDIKDWNFSRERYWGTPLPIWRCDSCKHEVVVGGSEDLSDKMGGSNNNYWVIRHGESEAQLLGINDHGEGNFHLTDKGRKTEEKTLQKLKKEIKGRKIDLIVSSDVLRTKESAEIASQIFGAEVVFDARLRDINVGNLSGKSYSEYFNYAPTIKERFERAPEGGESLRDVRARVWSAIKEIEDKYKGKNILIVSHQYPIWMVLHSTEGWGEKSAIEKGESGEAIFGLSEYRKIYFKAGPRNDSGEYDFHRPYIDDIKWKCEKCAGTMRRIKELADVWFDSGSMPLAQWHYPFENKQLIDKKTYFPADYISEAIDQTRGWFYTLLAVSTLLKRGIPYKNVLVLGHINDKFGQKMSKSKGNVVAPIDMIQKYGADGVRWYFFSGTSPAEPKNFDESEIGKALRNFHGMLYNSFVFWRTYAKPGSIKNVASKNVLDKWILARLSETEAITTEALENYQVREAAHALETLVEDLSRWYIRRSRRRLQKPLNAADFNSASNTLGYVLFETAKLCAPFMPFFSEALYSALGGKMESIHLDNWPKANKKAIKKELLKAMAETRELSSIGLAKRAEIGIKVRQPLASMKIKGKYLIKTKKDFQDIVKEEVNVKELKFVSKQDNPIELDTVITAELREEGLMRELVRAIQDLRQDAKLAPKDKIKVFIDGAGLLVDMAVKNANLLKKEVNALSIDRKRTEKFAAGIDTKMDGEEVFLAIAK